VSEPGPKAHRRRAQTWAFTLAFVGLLVGNGVFAWMAAESARDNAAPGEDPDYALAWGIAIGGAVAIVGLLVILVLTLRHQKRLAAANRALAETETRGLGLQEVTGRLARALDSDEVVTALRDVLPVAVGGQAGAVAVVDEEGRLGLLRPDAEPEPFAPAADGVIARVLADGEPAWLQSPLGWRGDDAADRLADGGWAMAVLPLVAEGVRGLVAVSYGRVHTFVDEERELLETVGVLAAQAFARGRRYDAEHRASVAFQQTALPTELPEVDGLTIAARYRAGASQADVGGDWYDVLVLDDDHVALLVGDVVGHGIEAAVAMGRLRTGFQMISSLRPEPSQMVQAVSLQVAAIPNAMCSTVVCAVIERSTGKMAWCRAGHLPPLIVRDGRGFLIEEAGVAPLGVAPNTTVPVHCEVLQPGDVVVLYTDGVIERRTESIDQGFERLRVASTELADLDPEDFSDALVEALVPVEEQTDDIALLVIRYDGVTP
jgi:serine phosphatase RsbU (regulator of sigma subunit)